MKSIIQRGEASRAFDPILRGTSAGIVYGPPLGLIAVHGRPDERLAEAPERQDHKSGLKPVTEDHRSPGDEIDAGRSAPGSQGDGAVLARTSGSQAGLRPFRQLTHHDAATRRLGEIYHSCEGVIVEIALLRGRHSRQRMAKNPARFSRQSPPGHKKHEQGGIPPGASSARCCPPKPC